MNTNMRIVLDTNVFLVSISRKSRSHWLFEAILDGQIELCLTNEILTEYEEMLATHWNASVAQTTIQTLLKTKTVHLFGLFFRFNLISSDEEDNKFVDCAVVSNADYLITNDKHFAVLKKIVFPPVNVISLDAFETLLRTQP